MKTQLSSLAVIGSPTGRVVALRRPVCKSPAKRPTPQYSSLPRAQFALSSPVHVIATLVREEVSVRQARAIGVYLSAGGDSSDVPGPRVSILV